MSCCSRVEHPVYGSNTSLICYLYLISTIFNYVYRLFLTWLFLLSVVLKSDSIHQLIWKSGFLKSKSKSETCARWEKSSIRSPQLGILTQQWSWLKIMTIGRLGWGVNERLPPTIAWRSICKLVLIASRRHPHLVAQDALDNLLIRRARIPDAYSMIESSDSRSDPTRSYITFSPLPFK